MADSSSDRYVLLTQLADEFAARYRRGERPSLQEYCDRHPELADDIREFFPTLVEMERVKDEVVVTAEAPPPPVPPIEQLGDFLILREIGHGGMGVVYEAEQVSLGRRVALKLLTQRMLRDANQRRRFEREAKSAARLHHTNIVPVFGSGEHEGIPYYAMQFIQGTGLDVVVEEVARLEGGAPAPDPPPFRRGGVPSGGPERPAAAVARSLLTGAFVPPTDDPEPADGVTGTFAAPAGANRHAPDGPADGPVGEVGKPPDPSGGTSGVMSGVTSSVTFPGHSGAGSGRKARKLTYWQGVARIGVQVADALQYAHRQGIIHRDVKPSNLLLDQTGTVWVTDFGLAKSDGAENLTHTGDILGTLRYMPPEAFDGKADARSDIYSLGLTLYEMIALRPAFHERDRNKLIKQVTTAEPSHLRKIRRGVPRDLETIVHKAIDREPTQRYQTAEELAADLQRFLDDEPIKARRQTAVEAAWHWARRHKAMAALVALSALVLVAVTVSSVILAAHFRQQEAVQRGLVEDKDRLVEDQTRLVEDKTSLADRNQRLADDNEKARETAEGERRQAETTLVDMQASRGLLAAERGDSALALLWFAKAAEQAVSDPRRRADNRLRAENWSRDVVLPVAVFSIGEAPRKLEFCPRTDLLLIRTETRFRVWDWHQEKALPWADGRLPISAACWSADGAHLAVGLPWGGVQIRSVPDGAILRTLPHPGLVSALAYSPDGQYLAVAGTVVRLWDTRDPAFLKPPRAPPGSAGTALKAVWAHPQPVDAVAFNGKGDRVATACRDKKARVFSVTEPARKGPLFPPLAHAPLVPSAPAFIDTDRGLVTVTGDRALTWWDAASGTVTRPDAVLSKVWAVKQVVAGPRGDCFVTEGEETTAEVCFVADGGRRPLVLEHLNEIYDYAFGADGNLLLTASRDHNARLWSLSDGRLVGSPLAHMGEVTKCAISDSSRYLATARSDGQVRIWKRPEPDPLGWESRNWALRPRVSFDGRLLAPGYWHENPFGHNGLERVVVLDTVTGKAAGPALPVPKIPFDSCVCADNRTLAVIARDDPAGWLTFWDVRGGRALFEPKKLPSRPSSVAARPKGFQVAVLCQAGEVLVFDTRTGERVLDLRHTGGPIDTASYARVEYTPEGTTLVALTDNGSAIYVWNAQTGEPQFPPIRPILADGPCRSFAISLDGKLLATAVNGKNAAQVWDLTTGRALSEPLPHPGDWYGLFHVSFSPDGRYLLTTCKDGQARVWDWRPGTLACPPLVHRDEVYAGVFTADGRYAITAHRGKYGAAHGKHGAVQVWELTTGKPVAPPIRFPTSVNALALSPDGSQVFVSADGTVAKFNLDELLTPPATPTADFALLGELTSAQQIERGGVSGLTLEHWLERWNQFHRGHPRSDSPARPEAVARAATHRQRARTLLETGHPSEALAAWRQALSEIDRATGRAEPRHPLRAEILKEARGLYEQFLAARPDHEAGARALADVLLDAREPVEWTVLSPTEVTSVVGTPLVRLSDGSVLTGGAAPPNDTYTLTARTRVPGITALRVEALTHPSLPRTGPGRNSDGNFCLTEVSLTGGPADGSGPARPIPFVRAAGYRRPPDTSATIGDGPHGTIDGTHDTRWDVWPLTGQTHALLLEPARPFGAGETVLTVRLDCQSPVYRNCALGRFRLSVTGRPQVVRDENLIALAEGKGGWLRLGAAYIVRADWAPALAALQKAAASPADAFDAHVLLALVHEQLGQPAEADKNIDAALKRHRIADSLILELALDVVAPRLARDPKNAPLLLCRFRWHALLGHTTDALADLDRAVQLDPSIKLRRDDSPALFELGHGAAARGEWPQVAAIYTCLVDLDSEDPWTWYLAAVTHAHLGNTGEYRRVCEGMLKKFGKTNDQFVADRIAKSRLLVPGAIPDLTEAVQLSELAVRAKSGADTWPWICLTRGLAEYRVGRFAASAEWCEKSLAATPSSDVMASARYVLAMAQYRQGAVGRARETFDRARALTLELEGPQCAKWKWHDWLIVYILRREAEALMAPPLAPPPHEVK